MSIKKSHFTIAALVVAIGCLAVTIKYARYYVVPKRFMAIQQNVYRGGKQTDRVFRELQDKYTFKTVVSLTGEFKEQEDVVTAAGGHYVFYNWQGSGIGP